ncbi:MAG: UDP-2,4-diacetamido-2,4,6-trideoxy-beta-L-altropyranose hydrolase [Lachnospiraceae bacterium]|nr:UDP-2,4-diacetamido-2,4,6-trideoxy-beta-L-altropyranose hydrolase [Lachnospiraceae bacterium]
MEIGSIFEVNPAVAAEGGETAGFHLAQVDKYGKKNQCYTASGREAIALALISLEREKPELPKRCLMPAYMCDSVFLPFLHRDWELIFYSVDREMETAGEEIFRLALENDPGLIFIHPYYGTDTCRGLRRQLSALRRNGVMVMEDVTQSYYLEEAGREADFVVGSLRKWYAVPDGGFVASDLPLSSEILLEGDDYAKERLIPLVQKWEYLRDENLPEEERQGRKSEFLTKNRSLEAELDRFEGVRAMSRLSVHILTKADEEAARQARAENYSYLYEKIDDMKRLWPILLKEKGEAPLYFPVYAKERDKMQGFLAERGVYAPVLWPVGEQNRDELQGDEAYIYEHMLALPIDQRYGAAEMERIAQILTLYENQPVIGIRVDANREIAMGHVMRCITIAKQLVNRGCRVLFLTADEWARETISEAGMEQICLHTRWDWMEEELPRLRQILTMAGVKTLLVDSYQATKEYFEGLKDLVRLVRIDDCFDPVCPVDILINYNAYHVRFPYEETYTGGTKLLLGTDYVPLREEFARAESVQPTADGSVCEECAGEDERQREEGFAVLLASGGGDAQDVLWGILQKAVADGAFENVTFHTVVGEFHPRGKELETFAESHPQVKVYRPCRDVAGLMMRCDAAVSAAGTMLFELAAMGVPAVFFQAADNQRYDREFFGEEERMLYAGDVRQDREGCLTEICENLKKLIADAALRGRMREALSRVTDGRGAARIAEEIAKL